MARKIEITIKGKEDDQLDALAGLLVGLPSYRVREVFHGLDCDTKRKIAGCIHGVMYEELNWKG